MLVSAGQLPPIEQADFAAAPPIPKVQTKESESSKNLAEAATFSDANEKVDAPTVVQKDELFPFSSSEAIPIKERIQDAPPPLTETTVPYEGSVEANAATKSSAPAPDDVLRAARAAPRLVPPFSAEANIAVEEGSLAEDIVDGVPKSPRFSCVNFL